MCVCVCVCVYVGVAGSFTLTTSTCAGSFVYSRSGSPVSVFSPREDGMVTDVSPFGPLLVSRTTCRRTTRQPHQMKRDSVSLACGVNHDTNTDWIVTHPSIHPS